MQKIIKLLGISAALAAQLALTPPVAAEELQGTTVESRLMLGFASDPAEVGQWLPEGWTPITLPQGGFSGSNLILSLMDRHLIMDAEGAAADPARSMAAALLVFGRNPDVEGVTVFVTRVYEPAPMQDPYGSAVEATLGHDYSSSGGSADNLSASHLWSVAAASGGELEVTLVHDEIGLGWSEGVSRPTSPVDTDFFRIYRYDQLAGLVMNDAIGKPLSGEVSVTSTIDELSGVLPEGAEPVAIVTIPVYVREIWLP